MGHRVDRIERVVLVCTGSDCKKAGAKKLCKAIRSCTAEMGLEAGTRTLRTRCQGLCSKAPIVCLMPHNVWLTEADGESVRKAVRRHFKKHGRLRLL